MTPNDEITLIKWTVALEAEGEPFEGKLAVAFVVCNRMRKWNKTAREVCWAKWQFSCYNDLSGDTKRLDTIDPALMVECANAAKYAYETAFADPTHGATHYLNEPLTRQLRGGSLPDWVSKMTKTAEIGKHTFYK